MCAERLTPGTVLTIMSGKSISGTFHRLPERSVLRAGGYLFRVSYKNNSVDADRHRSSAAQLGPGSHRADEGSRDADLGVAASWEHVRQTTRTTPLRSAPCCAAWKNVSGPGSSPSDPPTWPARLGDSCS